MKVNGTPYRSIWYDHDAAEVRIIDQRWLPHDFRIAPLKSRADFTTAIYEMWVRGAPAGACRPGRRRDAAGP